MKSEASAQLVGRRLLIEAGDKERERARSLRREGAVALLGGLLALVLVGIGLGWWVHPGAGLLASGLVLWVELFLWSAQARRAKK